MAKISQELTRSTDQLAAQKAILSVESQRRAETKTLHTRYRIRKGLRSLISHAFLMGLGLFFFIPFLWMLSTAFKSDQDVFRTPPTFIPHDNMESL
jgi:ABC-type glycerol-3-phosphate transport system permease component